MAEQIVDYQIGADATALKRAMAEAEAAAQKLGQSIGNALAKGGADGTRDLGQSLDRGLDDAGRRSSRTAQAIGTAIGRALGVGLVAAAGAAFARAFEQLKEIDDLAKKTGLSTSRIGAIQNVGSSEGVGAADINKGLSDLGARANEEFREGEGKLKELLEANNLAITNRAGELKSTNDLLEDAARLVSNAKTEFDKIDIARIFGLSEEWVKVLERGPDELRKSITAAEEVGGKFDAELVQRAADFDKAWNAAIAAFGVNFKATLADIAGAISGIIAQAQQLGAAVRSAQLGTVNQELTGVQTRLRDQGLSPLQRRGLQEQERNLLARRGQIEGLDALQRDAVPVVNLPLTPARAAASPGGGTVIPVKEKTGGGTRGGGGKSEEDSALSRLENYTLALQRQGDVLAAEIETFGKSNAERKAAVELAKAKNDLDKLDEETKARVSEQIRQAVAVNEQYRESLDRLKGAQQAANFAADQFADALGDIIVDGKNAEDVLRGLVKNFAKQAISSLFAGNGSFSGLFGQQKGGIFGSLFSGLFGGKFADGGELPRGISLVGERGPELIRNAGNGAARVYPSGQGPAGAIGGSTQYVTIDARGADAGAVSRIEGALRAMDKQFSARVISVNRQSQVRGIA